MAKVKKIRWRKNPRETGLRSVGAGPQGHRGRVGDVEVASVNASGGTWRGPLKGWYFVLRLGDEYLYNSYCGESLFATADDAKAACQAHYVKYTTTTPERRES